MPWKIPATDWVVTGHRGTALSDHRDQPLVKQLTGQPKDELEAEYAAHPFLRPRPKPRGPLPTVSVKQATGFTRLGSSAALARADARESLLLATADQVKQAVQAHIGTRLAALGGGPWRSERPIVLVGEAHFSNTSLLVTLASLASFKGRGATVLVEQDAASMASLFAQARRLDEAISADRGHAARTLQALWCHADPAYRYRARMALVALVAGKSGGRVASFDAGRASLASQDEREAAMERCIRRHAGAGNADPVIVLVGSHHLPLLHDHLHRRHPTLSLSAITDANVEPESSDDRKRASCLFSQRDILKIRGRRETLENLSIDPVAEAATLFDLSAPLRPDLDAEGLPVLAQNAHGAPAQ